MQKKETLKPIALAATLAISVATIPMAQAEHSPFAAKKLDKGFQVASSHKDGSCGAGKCGANKKDKSGNCGADKKDKEGNCGNTKKDDDTTAKS